MTSDEDQPWMHHWSARYGAGTDRLEAWLAAGSPEADRSQLSIVGDRRIVAAVRAVVEQLPEAVAWFLVGNAMIVCTGRDSRGWCGEWPVPPCDTPSLVALAVDDPAVIAHELAHAWHRRPLPAAARLDAAQLARLRAAVSELAVEDDNGASFVDGMLEAERAADALATAWGFDIDTTSGEAGARRRRGLMADVGNREPPPSDVPPPSRSSPAGVDDSTLRIAVAELTAGREMLLTAHQIIDRHARREAIKTAIGRLALAARAIDEVVDRRG